MRLARSQDEERYILLANGSAGTLGMRYRSNVWKRGSFFPSSWCNPAVRISATSRESKPSFAANSSARDPTDS